MQNKYCNMNSNNIIHTFNENECKIKIPITKKGQIATNCDLFFYECFFVLVTDVDTYKFECPRQFDFENMKDIPISFNSEQWEYTCILPCYPKEEETQPKVVSPCQFIRITDLCVLSVDGKICEVQADFPYGFSKRYRGKPKYSDGDLSHICRIPDPSLLSNFQRTWERENDEKKDFCPDQYKINFLELQIPEGHENPMDYKYTYEDVSLTKEEEYILENIKSKHTHIDVETERMDIDNELISILLGICYDIRVTSNEPTCESAWTRTTLSPVLSYFEPFDSLSFVVESFIRRSMIYPLYRKYVLSRLCVQDAVDAMLKGKTWILKQLLVTYNCFCEAAVNRKALNKYFIRHYIWYVDVVLDDDHLQIISANLASVLLQTSENNLRLGLQIIQGELLSEVIGVIPLIYGSALQEVLPSSSEESEEGSSSEYETDGFSD